MMEKKGVSDIIATVLIILIVFAAIIMVWNVVKKTVTEKSGEIGIEKFSVGLSTQQVNLSENPIRIPVERKVGQGDISAIKIIFKNSTGASYEYDNNTLTPKELETVIYYINRTLVVNTIGEGIESFEVYPVFTSGGRESIGMKASVAENLGSVTSLGAPTNMIMIVSGCGEINQSGEYVLNNSIINDTLKDSGKEIPCINITAENVVLDCAGKYIKSESNATGIYSNRKDTTIKNCNISMGIDQNGGYGIYLTSTLNAKIENIIIYHNRQGIYINGVSNSSIDNIEGNSNTQGIYFHRGLGNKINNVKLSLGYAGIWLDESSNNTFTNIISNNNNLAGIYISQYCLNNSFMNVVVNNNTWEGITLYISHYNLLYNITAMFNKNGISVSGMNNTIINSTAENNSQYGMYLRGLTNSTVKNNRACNSVLYNDFDCYGASEDTFSSNVCDKVGYCGSICTSSC